MPRTKKKSETKKKIDTKQRAEMLTDNLRARIANFSLSRSYTSLVYGIITLIVLFALGFAAVRLFTQEQTPEISQQGVDSTIEENNNEYVVKEGETLWSIAEQEYNDGFAWGEIAQANELPDPNNLEAGTRLIIPERTTPEQAQDSEEQGEEVKVAPTEDVPTPTAVSEQMQIAGEQITGSEYTVVAGDTLWDISIRAYGDGYRWPEIAASNNIVNPDLIYVGTTLSLQR